MDDMRLLPTSTSVSAREEPSPYSDPFPRSTTSQASDPSATPTAHESIERPSSAGRIPTSHTNGNMTPFPYANASAPQDSYMSSDPGLATSMISPTHTAASLSAQKRAYRQRRKDPSCDACRERKVKCDATETSSCSECSSRGVKCQFTKETNRRMSSIKQVQDLERQLLVAKQQISALKIMMQQNDVRESNETEPQTATSDVPTLHLLEPPSKERRSAPPAIEEFDEVRINIRTYGRGIFKPPPPYRVCGAQPSYPHVMHALPPKIVADRLLSHYHGSVHVYSPCLHWPTFIEEVERLYRLGSFAHCSHIWVAQFYAVLACGTLMDPQPNGLAQDGDGAQYMDMCLHSINTWSDELSMDSARTALLTSIFFFEINLRSAGWMWLGAAVRIALDIGLHTDRGPYQAAVAEKRRRVWWSIYNWDRIVSLEIGRPLQIDDDDCDVSEPTPVDDECIQENGIVMPTPGTVAPNGLVATIPVVRLVAQLKKSLKSRTIAAATLSTYDEHFKSIMTSFPDPYPINSQSYLDPRLLYAACSLQIARFLLYRHNLSPVCRRPDRADALDRCVSVAKDTAHYVQRSMLHSTPSSGSGFYSQSQMANWGARLRTMAPAFFCTHLWRCALVLCFRLEYSSALTIVQASASIGDLRKNNVACGRNLAFFIDKLVNQLRTGATQEALEQDEELIAYVSGDLQGCSEESWVWTGSEIGAHLRKANTSTLDHSNGQTSGRSPNPPATSALSDSESQDWGGWDHIHRTLSQLLHEQQRPPLPPHTNPGQSSSASYTAARPPLSHTPIHHLAPQLGSEHPSLSPVPSNGGSSRISIRDLM